MGLDRPLNPADRDVLDGEYQRASPTAPVRLPGFTTAQLTGGGKFAPAKWPRCQVWNTTLGQPCVSDGTFWYPVTLGVHL